MRRAEEGPSGRLQRYLDIARFSGVESLARVTAATVDVLTCLINGTGTDAATWGLEIVRRSSRPPGTVYPILERLERARWVESHWEDDNARPGPRRRLYELTADGAVAARATVESFAARVAASTRPRPAHSFRLPA